jgi:hypothetical protein
MMRVIFDLDGTLANADHRAHHLTGEVKDWRAFYAECAADEPVRPLILIAQTLAVFNWEVHIWTGRSAEVADKTEVWLAAQGLDDFSLRMRAIGDHRPDTKLKAGWLAECGWVPDLVFEERSSVVAMWRAHGILCAQVAPGDF